MITIRDLYNSVGDKIANEAQELIDRRIQQMEFEDTETMSIEDARAMTLAAVGEEYKQ